MLSFGNPLYYSLNVLHALQPSSGSPCRGNSARATRGWPSRPTSPAASAPSSRSAAGSVASPCRPSQATFSRESRIDTLDAVLYHFSETDLVALGTCSRSGSAWSQSSQWCGWRGRCFSVSHRKLTGIGMRMTGMKHCSNRF